MKITLVNNRWSGHNPYHIRELSLIFLSFPGIFLSVYCVEPDILKQEIYNVLGTSNSRITFHKILLPDNILKNKTLLSYRNYSKKLWINIANQIYSDDLQRPNHQHLVFFGWLDDYLAPLLYHMPDNSIKWNWSGIYFHPSFYVPYKTSLLFKNNFSSSFIYKIQRFLTYPYRKIKGFLHLPYNLLFHNSCSSICVLNEHLETKMNNVLNKPVITIPDFTNSDIDTNYFHINNIHSLSKGKKIVGLIGGQSNRKSFDILLQASQILSNNYYFIFAGPYHDDFSSSVSAYNNSIINNKPANCYFLLERIPDESQFNSILNCCDIIFASYRIFPNSSNIMTKAAVFKKPIIVSEGHLMAERTRKYGLGEIIPEGDVNACVRAIEKLASTEGYNSWLSNSRCEEYAEQHSHHKLKDALRKVLQAAGYNEDNESIAY